jgi:hypothetical protein
MKRPLFAFLTLVCLQLVAFGQSDQRAERAIELLKILENQVIVHDSLVDFQESGKLARVSFEVFKRDLDRVSTEVEFLLSALPENKLKNQIRNALCSYQDGAFWWEKMSPARVVTVSQLRATETNLSASDRFHSAAVPYTVAINWRHGANYLKRAKKLLDQP